MNLNDIVPGVAYELTGKITGRFPDRVSDDVEFKDLYESLLAQFHHETFELCERYGGEYLDEENELLDEFYDDYLDKIIRVWACAVSDYFPSEAIWEIEKLIHEIIHYL